MRCCAPAKCAACSELGSGGDAAFCLELRRLENIASDGALGWRKTCNRGIISGLLAALGQLLPDQLTGYVARHTSITQLLHTQFTLFVSRRTHFVPYGSTDTHVVPVSSTILHHSSIHICLTATQNRTNARRRTS